MNNRIYCLTMAFLLATVASAFTGLSVSNSPGAQAEATTANLQNFNWTKVSSPVTTILNSVAMVSANDGWAVGENGTLLHYDGNAWISYSLPVTTTLLSVSMSSANNGWALGLDNTSTYIQILLRWNGSGWESVTNPSPPWPFWMSDISVPNDTSAWVAGGIIVCSAGPSCNPSYATGTISHWNGSSWSNTSIPNVFLSSISMTSDTDGWAVGTEVVQSTKRLRSSIMHWDGSTWTSITHPITEYPGGSVQYILEEVSALNATNAWAAISHQNTLLRWNGTTWTQVDSPVGGRPSIATISTNDAWAVGGEGVIGHWDGNIWTQVSSPVTVTLTSVAMVSANEGWAVGNGGTIVHGIRDLADADLQLSIMYAGNGAGTVTDTLASGTLVLPSIYAYGSVVTLTASANADSSFASWSGAVTSMTNPITVTMDEDKTITATFDLKTYTLTINKTGNGTGVVTDTLSSGTLVLPTVYTHGSVVSLTATADPASTFAGWSGNVIGIANPITVTMNANKIVTATFSLRTYTLTVNYAGNGNGMVTKTPNLPTYTHGTVVSLTATVNTASAFAGWSGDVTGLTNPIVVTMNANKVVTATFISYRILLPLILR